MLLSSAAGKVIASIRRIIYVTDQEHSENTQFELTFADNTVFLLGVASDGDSMSLSTTPWNDPFHNKRTPENLEFLQKSGHWVASDASDSKALQSMIGGTIQLIQMIIDYADRVTGVIFELSNASVIVRVAGDMLSISLEP